MTTELAPRDMSSIIEQVLIKGDLGKLTPEERVIYYREVCRSLGLNELTKPFEYITLNGKLTLYARKDCTDQLRDKHRVSVRKIEREQIGDLYVVTVYATDNTGRTDSDMGAVNIKGLTGENLANAMLKAMTKAKRRVTLSICGLGWTDESEVDSIPTSRTIVVDHTTGEVLEERPNAEMVTDATDKLWQLWLKRKQEAYSLGALSMGLDLDELTLPVPREVLLEQGKELAMWIAEQKGKAA